jgi:hypothetical protein
MAVAIAVSGALEKIQVARLPQQKYFGASKATIFSNRGDRAADPMMVLVQFAKAGVWRGCDAPNPVIDLSSNLALTVVTHPVLLTTP